MTTYPLSTLACSISDTGITAPTYGDILESLKASYRSIFGSDVYLDADSQDGQWLAIFAAAVNDCNAATIATYNSRSPVTAQGAALASLVKLSGISKMLPSSSTADLVVTGTAGTVITNGLAGDGVTQWALPTPTTIPLSGTITVTATCTTAGAVDADANTITIIATPTLGWLSVDNPAPAVTGDPVETDAALRRRQADSVALPAMTPLDGIIAAVANVAGIARYKGYENPTGSPDGDGIPAHSISIVAEGGDAQLIANAIALKKTPGAFTYGTTSESVTDSRGIIETINFFRPTEATILVEIDATALTGWASTTQALIKTAVAAAISALDIGEDVYRTKLFSAANLPGNPLGDTFNITAIRIAKSPGSPSAADVVIAFNEAANCLTANITTTVT